MCLRKVTITWSRLGNMAYYDRILVESTTGLNQENYDKPISSKLQMTKPLSNKCRNMLTCTFSKIVDFLGVFWVIKPIKMIVYIEKINISYFLHSICLPILQYIDTCTRWPDQHNYLHCDKVGWHIHQYLIIKANQLIDKLL